MGVAMQAGKLTEQIKRGVSQSSVDVADWIVQKLAEEGPWHKKPTEKETVNCLMRYHLGNSNEDTSEVCQYLNDEDSDEAWVQSIVNKVAPVVIKNCR
jgi:hypothetical protein